MEVGLNVLLQLVDNGVIKFLEFNFFYLCLHLNFKPYFIMQLDVMCEKAQKSSVSELDPIISLLISNYPLANGGYLVSFGQDEPDGSFKSYDPVRFFDYEASKLSKFLDFSSIFLPKGCYYLPEMELAGFVCSLASGASCFEMKFLPPASQIQGLLMVKVNESSFLNYEQEEED